MSWWLKFYLWRKTGKVNFYLWGWKGNVMAWLNFHLWGKTDAVKFYLWLRCGMKTLMTIHQQVEKCAGDVWPVLYPFALCWILLDDQLTPAPEQIPLAGKGSLCWWSIMGVGNCFRIG
jgi:hypothetical protein